MLQGRGSLLVLSTLNVEPGAEKLITRFDLNGDSVPEMVVRSKDSTAFTTVYEDLSSTFWAPSPFQETQNRIS